MTSTKYAVVFEDFTKRHYIKTFAKKYKRAWEVTLQAITEEFERIDVLALKSIAEPITDSQADIVIFKTEFKISGTQESRHGSGNRCIIAVHESTAAVHVLLVYSKGDVHGSNETAWWRGVVKDNHPAYTGVL